MATSKVAFLIAAALLFAAPVGEEEPAPAEPVVKGFVGPQVILGTQQPPDFPPAAWDARYTGSVSLEVTVLADGSVGDVNVIGCTRPKVGFEEQAVQAVKKWRFEPGKNDGVPVEVTTKLRLNFTRVRVGQKAEPQVSAGSFTVASIDRGSAPPPPASDPK
jgi:TonB family protein